MPVPVARDLDETRSALQRWFNAAGHGDPQITVNDDLVIPQGVGNANETIVFSLNVDGPGRPPVHEELVLRIAPAQFPLFMDVDFGEQAALLQAVRSAGVAAPVVRHLEAESDVLGAPFYVMARAPGRVPPDHADHDWTLDLDASAQRRLWEAGVEALCSVSAAPVTGVAPLLSARGEGADETRRELDYWRRYLVWADLEDDRLSRLQGWLELHIPARVGAGLSWGDARMSNLVFDDDCRCTAILDWEMASLGGPLMDLGYWLFFDQFWQVSGQERPKGYGDRDDTLTLWRDLTGLPTDGVHWYEVFAAYRLGAIAHRLVSLNLESGVDLRPFDPAGMFISVGERLID